jgi:hypothetical protein
MDRGLADRKDGLEDFWRGSSQQFLDRLSLAKAAGSPERNYPARTSGGGPIRAAKGVVIRPLVTGVITLKREKARLFKEARLEKQLSTRGHKTLGTAPPNGAPEGPKPR